jgi:hypothetical protein
MNEYARTTAAPWTIRRRRLAVVLWSGFFTAILSTALLLAFLPDLHPNAELSWDLLGRWFLMSWLLGIIPIAASAVLLHTPSRADRKESQ